MQHIVHLSENCNTPVVWKRDFFFLDYKMAVYILNSVDLMLFFFTVLVQRASVTQIALVLSTRTDYTSNVGQ